MSDEPEQIPADAPSPDARVEAPPPVEAEPAPVTEPAGATAMGGAPASAPAAEDPHPEYQVAAAFAGAFLFAKLLRRVGRRK
jgi:hypothetical protein